MEFNEYQTEAYKTAVYPKNAVPHYNGLAITEEAGEIAGKIKRFYRDGITIEQLREQVKKESGDLIWEICALLTELGLTLEEVMEDNLAKLRDRAARNVIHGSGDSR